MFLVEFDVVQYVRRTALLTGKLHCGSCNMSLHCLARAVLSLCGYTA